jgi:hypothetical protein
LLVSLADKVHNAEAIAADNTNVGPEVWKRFKGGYEGTVWYYRALHDIYVHRMPGPLCTRLSAAIGKMKNLDPTDQ